MNTYLSKSTSVANLIWFVKKQRTNLSIHRNKNLQIEYNILRILALH